MTEQRNPEMPDVPTLKELGYNVEFYLWVGMFGVFIVAQFWAFAADLYADERGMPRSRMIAAPETGPDRRAKYSRTSSARPTAGDVLDMAHLSRSRIRDISGFRGLEAMAGDRVC